MNKVNKGKTYNNTVVLLVLVILGFGYWYYQNHNLNITWQGFYYGDGIYHTDMLSQIAMLDEAPKFNTLQDCMKWGGEQISINNTTQSDVPVITEEMLARAHLYLSKEKAERIKKAYQVQQNTTSGGFECSYGCRYDKEWKSIICKDTTKMITRIEKGGVLE